MLDYEALVESEFQYQCRVFEEKEGRLLTDDKLHDMWERAEVVVLDRLADMAERRHEESKEQYHDDL